MLTELNILVVDCGSSKVPDIVNALSQNGIQVGQKKLSELNGAENEYQGIVISGAPILLTEEDHKKYSSRILPLLNKERPLLGICFGHQLLGLLHNTGVVRCDEDRGWQEITIIHPGGIFEGFNNWVMLKEDHCECIGLPDGFRRTAGSSVCANEAMQHEKYPWYGVQFHPEVSGEQGQNIFNNFIKICRTWF